ncbi:hypothetical protein Ae717Ps2_7105 [Pseudonocardia sp. Ae717_Ps2]|uniref:hypothetical protein n=1 Tax=Pseudonocardia sp. Ae717_Ps2 TaxID=1885573 RepID=UPI00094B5FAF|nr:hypothetical protein [Pseudonocardia sp. Ae717_Ps2]OLM27887.1 hypothetical protein Ae717Ps2_7105 [Pseudonocardia sp. Ae717_Ps2]
MAGLIDQAKSKPRLRRAADADRDPADLPPAPATAVPERDHPDAAPERPAADPTPDPVDGPAVVSARGNDSGEHGRTDRERAGSPRPAARSAAKRSATDRTGNGRRPRRVGRPRGPERVQLSTRILVDLDAALTDAVERSGLSPQPIVEEALRDWLTSHGYLPTPPERDGPRRTGTDAAGPR